MLGKDKAIFDIYSRSGKIIILYNLLSFSMSGNLVREV